jgi:ABC-type antimicrobial peptide transport system permease subunit
VTRRSREIGIRLALGDRPGRVLLRTARESGVLVLAGIAAGLTIATLAAPALRGLLGQERLGDPVAIAATIGILLATGMLAALSPAQRAARVDPATLLRRE